MYLEEDQNDLFGSSKKYGLEIEMEVRPSSALAQIRDSTALTITRVSAAAALGVDPRTVTAGINSGDIPAIKLGRRVLIPREKFLALFEVVDE